MADEIRRIREKYHLTQAQLAEMLEVSQPRIARMESQKTVTIETIRKIAAKLGVKAKDLINNNH